MDGREPGPNEGAGRSRVEYSYIGPVGKHRRESSERRSGPSGTDDGTCASFEISTESVPDDPLDRTEPQTLVKTPPDICGIEREMAAGRIRYYTLHDLPSKPFAPPGRCNEHHGDPANVLIRPKNNSSGDQFTTASLQARPCSNAQLEKPVLTSLIPAGAF